MLPKIKNARAGGSPHNHRLADGVVGEKSKTDTRGDRDRDSDKKKSKIKIVGNEIRTEVERVESRDRNENASEEKATGGVSKGGCCATLLYTFTYFVRQ